METNIFRIDSISKNVVNNICFELKNSMNFYLRPHAGSHIIDTIERTKQGKPKLTEQNLNNDRIDFSFHLYSDDVDKVRKVVEGQSNNTISDIDIFDFYLKKSASELGFIDVRSMMEGLDYQ